MADATETIANAPPPRDNVRTLPSGGTLDDDGKPLVPDGEYELGYIDYSTM